MRLHLPKTLLAAVLAACAALPAGATITETTLTSLTVQGADLPTAPEGQTTVYKQAVNEPATDEEKENEIPSALESATATFLSGTNAVKVLNSSTVKNAGTLVIAKATVNGTESNAGQLHLSRWSKSTGSIDTGLEIANDLIIGETAAGNAIRLSDANSDVRLITLTGTITLAQDAQIGVDSTVTSGHGKITGSISGAGRTLTIASGGNKSGVLNLGDGTSGKTLTLGGLTVADATGVVMNYETATIGTLTLNSSSTSAALTLTGSGTTTITSLVTSGSVLDASEMTGTLTIEGAKWTGNLTVASVEVLKAKDAGTATILANSMNTTRGISYSFSATDTSVYRVLRTDSLTDLTAELQGNPGSRIVVNATYDGTTFTNVGLNELLAGDKVTINGLTGWIGDNSSNSISANLVFEGVNSINNGSSNGTINYSGAISGSGTLSFDWIATESDGSTTIKTNTYVFTGDLSGFAGTIKDDATLNVTIGGTLANGVSNAVNGTIDIAGILTVNRETTFTKGFTAKQLNGNQRIYIEGDQTITCTQDGNYSANIDVKSGKLTVGGFVKTSGELDMKKSDNYTGYVEVARGGVLTVGSNIWGMAATSKILLQEEGSLKWNGFTITGKAAKEGVDTGLKFGVDNYLVTNNSAHTVTNSTITYTGTDSKTLGWTLTDTDLDVKSGTLRLGADVNASNVTVRNGSTLELVSGWKQGLSSSNTTWEAGSTLKYVRTASGNDAIDVVNLDSGVGSGATIELNGVKGTLKSVGSSIKADIRLTNSSVAAGEFTTIEGDSYTFDGKVKGDGNFALNHATVSVGDQTKTKETSLIFNGDLSEWTSGSNEYAGLRAVSGTVNATISGTPTNKVVSNAFNKDSGGTLNLTIARDAVLTNKINITSLAVNTGKTLELRNDTNDVAVGSTTVGARSKLILNNKRTAEDGATTYGSIDLGTVSGSGTISSSMESQSISLSTDKAKTFSGTLEATSGKLTVTGMSIADGYHLMTALKAAGGNLDLMNTPLVSITEMVIGENATVGVYGGTTASEENEGGVYVHGVDASTKGALTVESGATLKSDLQLVNTVLTFNGSLTMGSDLTLYSGNELAGSLYTSWDKKSALTLFTGVDNLTIGTEVAVADKEYKASEVFSNIGNDYSLKMTGSTGDYIVQLVQNTPAPEPTTATLSLLALMGLAARRRRRKA
ncbi:MAG: hypothetical protein MR894_08800 [Akkermansia muciniphila]|nr:hypothetical protein [Akkermansia muciniphila]